MENPKRYRRDICDEFDSGDKMRFDEISKILENDGYVVKPGTKKVGDWVGFKCDIEQYGQIVKIERTPNGELFTLRNEGGFEGEYIGGDTETTQYASDCWN